MRILIIEGRDKSSKSRIVSGFSNLNNAVFWCNSYDDIPDSKFDLTFVDPSVSFEVFDKINSDMIFFYDCQDQPTHFDPDVAYYELKDKVVAYAKMSWVDKNTRNDSIKNIGFPLPVYSYLRNIANQDILFKQSSFSPLLVCSPTFRSLYEPIKSGVYNSVDGISCLSNPDKKFDIYGDKILHYMYNQRIDWLLSLLKSKTSFYGGLVFSEKNLSLEFQSDIFGDVSALNHSPVKHIDMLSALYDCKIGLCPTGHGRISWRTFDIMALGAILIWTETSGEKSMIMPKEYVEVPDGTDLSSILSGLNYNKLLKAAQDNRFLLNKTDDEFMKIFMDQLEK